MLAFYEEIKRFIQVYAMKKRIFVEHPQDAEKNINRIGLDLCLDVVKEFQNRFNNPVSKYPQSLSNTRLSVRVDYLKEEINELSASNCVEDQCDALIDIIYFALGGLGEIGVDPQKIFMIVHHANMTKAFPDGSVRYHQSNGKVAKPPGWIAPRDLIREEIRAQIEQRTRNDKCALVEILDGVS